MHPPERYSSLHDHLDCGFGAPGDVCLLACLSVHSSVPCPPPVRQIRQIFPVPAVTQVGSVPPFLSVPSVASVVCAEGDLSFCPSFCLFVHKSVHS